MTDPVPAQSARQASVRSLTGTELTYEGDWLALFVMDGVTGADADGAEFDGLMGAWCNLVLGTAYNNTLEAMNAFALSQGAQNFGVMGTFTGVAPATEIVPDPPPPGTEDVAWDGFTVTATRGTAPFTYFVHHGALPAGTTLHSTTGVVDGTPTESGTFHVVIKATDANGKKVYSKSIPIVIAP